VCVKVREARHVLGVGIRTFIFVPEEYQFSPLLFFSSSSSAAAGERCGAGRHLSAVCAHIHPHTYALSGPGPFPPSPAGFCRAKVSAPRATTVIKRHGRDPVVHCQRPPVCGGPSAPCPQDAPRCSDVVLPKPADGGFGFTITGGHPAPVRCPSRHACPRGASFCPDLRTPPPTAFPHPWTQLVVAKIKAGSPADGLLDVGDQVLELDGKSMEGVTQFKVRSRRARRAVHRSWRWGFCDLVGRGFSAGGCHGEGCFWGPCHESAQD
jgi:hypothetical protein